MLKNGNWIFSALFHIKTREFVSNILWMVVPTKTLSVPKFEIATYSVEFLLIVFSYIVHAIPEKFKRGERGAGRRGGWGHANSKG